MGGSMDKGWTRVSDAIVTKFPTTKIDNKDNNKNNTHEEEVATENNKNNAREDVHSIVFAFIVVFIYFSGVYFLKTAGELTFDNVIVLTVLVCIVAEFVRSHNKKYTTEIIDFKEPKI